MVVKKIDKQELAVGLLRVCKAHGIDPPPQGVQVRPGHGRCTVLLDAIVVFAEAPAEDWVGTVVEWCQVSLARIRGAQIRRIAEPRAGGHPGVRVGHLELEDDLGGQVPVRVVDGLTAGRIAKLEFN